MITPPKTAIPSDQPTDKVPASSKLAYGVAGSVDIWAHYIPLTLTNPIFVVLFGISPATISLVSVVFRVWDAFTDPIIGWWSDRTHTRWGRRKPFIVAGAVATGMTFPLLWFCDPGWSQPALVAWYVGACLLLFTSAAVWNVPYQSMLLEMTPGYEERTSVTAYRAFFQKCAALLVGWVWWLTQMPLFHDAAGQPDTLLGAQVISAILGLIIVALGVLPALFIKERHYESATKGVRVSIVQSFRLTFANKPFVLLATFGLLLMIGTNIAAGMGFYLRLFFVSGGDAGLAAKLEGLAGTVTLLTGLAGIPFFQWLSHRIGKTYALMIAMGVVLTATTTTLFTFDPAHPYLSLTAGVLIAPGNTGIWLLLPSMNADVVDYDELRTSERREGAFASIYSWVVKLSWTIGSALSGPVIVWAGYNVALKPRVLEPDVLWNMRIIYAFLPALFLIPAILLLLKYPLSPRRMAEIRATLEARRGKV